MQQSFVRSAGPKHSLQTAPIPHEQLGGECFGRTVRAIYVALVSAGNALVEPIADQLALRVVERPIITIAVVPDVAVRPLEELRLARRQYATDRVPLITLDTAHDPAIQVDALAADILERHRLGPFVNRD